MYIPGSTLTEQDRRASALNVLLRQALKENERKELAQRGIEIVPFVGRYILSDTKMSAPVLWYFFQCIGCSRRIYLRVLPLTLTPLCADCFQTLPASAVGEPASLPQNLTDH